MARAGVAARTAQLRLERSRYFPDVGVGLSARWSRAPLVTDQMNPFYLDNANFLRYGAAVVLRWKLDLLPQAAREAQAAAQLEEMRATERYALGGVGVEVEQAFQEAKDAERRLDAYTRAASYARQWLIKVQQGIDETRSAQNIALLADFYHLAVNGDDVAAVIEAHTDRIGHIQIADSPARNEPGTGELNYPYILNHLDTIGYDGWIVIEAEQDPALAPPRQYAELGLRTLRTHATQAGLI